MAKQGIRRTGNSAKREFGKMGIRQNENSANWEFGKLVGNPAEDHQQLQKQVSINTRIVQVYIPFTLQFIYKFKVLDKKSYSCEFVHF